MGELDSVLSSPDSYDPAYVGEVRLVLVMVQADGASSAAQQFAEWLVTNYQRPWSRAGGTPEQQPVPLHIVPAPGVR
jgi:hypothetical protein